MTFGTIYKYRIQIALRRLYLVNGALLYIWYFNECKQTHSPLGHVRLFVIGSGWIWWVFPDLLDPFSCLSFSFFQFVVFNTLKRLVICASTISLCTGDVSHALTPCTDGVYVIVFLALRAIFSAFRVVPLHQYEVAQGHIFYLVVMGSSHVCHVSFW